MFGFPLISTDWILVSALTPARLCLGDWNFMKRLLWSLLLWSLEEKSSDSTSTKSLFLKMKSLKIKKANGMPTWVLGFFISFRLGFWLARDFVGFFNPVIF